MRHGYTMCLAFASLLRYVEHITRLGTTETLRTGGGGRLSIFLASGKRSENADRYFWLGNSAGKGTPVSAASQH